MINWLAIAFSGILGFGLLSVISSVIMSLFRNLAWFSKGMREYTKSGYESAASKFDPNELTGLIIIHLLDLSKPNDVHSFGKQFANNNDSRLDILINNAGCMINEYKTDENGIEANFATNTLGTYILTECLIPALKKSPDARVITVSSGGMLVQKLNHTDLMFTAKRSKFDGTTVYAQNKRQQVVMTEMWAKNYPEIFFCSMHPGWADTPAVALSMPSFYNKMKNKLRTPEQGADTVIWLALVPNVRRYPNGSFFQDRHVVSQHLKLGCTQSTDYEKQRFMSNLADIAAPFFK
ncbi:Dehydrogenase/reductase SDR family member 12 [Schistosoma japonicum]|nr:Dehydrogenase/reductase SDR family member 12 [Schistosoma japonicum]